MAPEPYVPPGFCDRCGSPFPWASDQALVYEIENKLADAELAEGDRRLLMRRLEKARRALERGEDEENALLEALSAIRERTPAVFNGLLPVIRPLATAYIRQKLGLPPSS